jgi:transcription elongation factor GreB
MFCSITLKMENREDQRDDPDSEAEEESSGLPSGFKNYMTPIGAAKLQAELRALLHDERPKLVKVIEWAAGNGDRSENADYIYGKRRLREIDRRIRFLTKRLEAAVVVDPKDQKGKVVLFGATVTIEDEQSNQRTYQIVGIDESNPAHGQISWVSPLAKALIGKSKGEVIIFRAPKGEEDLEIIHVEYK